MNDQEQITPATAPAPSAAQAPPPPTSDTPTVEAVGLDDDYRRELEEQLRVGERTVYQLRKKLGLRPGQPVVAPPTMHYVPSAHEDREKQLKWLSETKGQIRRVTARLGIFKEPTLYEPPAHEDREKQLKWLSEVTASVYRVRKRLGIPEGRPSDADRKIGSVFGYRHGYRDGACDAIANLLSYGLSLTQLRDWMTAVVAWSLSCDAHRTPTPKVPEQSAPEERRGL